MNVLNYRISLDMFDAVSQITIKAKKGDSACRINITLTENGKIYHISEGSYATFHAKKFDGNFVDGKCTIENNTIVYDFTSSIDNDGVAQISACEGIAECDVTLYNDKNEKLTSPCFNLFIDGTVYNGEEIFSTTKSDVLEKLICDYVSSNYPIEQSYNPNSENAQSGKAVKEAIGNALRDVGNSFANAIKQTTSGNPISAHDVSPMEHELNIKLKSKNLLPPTLTVALPYTQNGVTVSQMVDGVHLSGNLTGPNQFSFSLGTVRLPAGTYVLGGLVTIGTNSETSNVFLQFPDSFSSYITLTEEKDVPITVNVGHYEETTIKVDAFVYPVVISKEYVDEYSFNEYIPYNMDFSNVSVRKYGSNLLNINTDKLYTSASTIQVLEDKVRVTKTAASKWCCVRWVLPITVAELDKQRIYFQGTVSRNTGIRVCMGYSYADGTNYTNVTEKTVQDFSMYMDIDASNTTYQHIAIQLYVDVSKDGAIGDYTEFSKLRVTIGQNAYTPYIEPQIAQADKEGVVSVITSLSPNITVVTDNPNVTLECEYNADTKMYIDKKFAELSAALLNS